MTKLYQNLLHLYFSLLITGFICTISVSNINETAPNSFNGLSNSVFVLDSCTTISASKLIKPNYAIFGFLGQLLKIPMQIIQIPLNLFSGIFSGNQGSGTANNGQRRSTGGGPSGGGSGPAPPPPVDDFSENSGALFMPDTSLTNSTELVPTASNDQASLNSKQSYQDSLNNNNAMAIYTKANRLLSQKSLAFRSNPFDALKDCEDFRGVNFQELNNINPSVTEGTYYIITTPLSRGDSAGYDIYKMAKSNKINRERRVCMGSNKTHYFLITEVL